MPFSRCFPLCCEGGHRDSGFCGRSISAIINVNKFNKGNDIQWDELLVISDIHVNTTVTLKVGDILTKASILPFIKLENSPPGMY